MSQSNPLQHLLSNGHHGIQVSSSVMQDPNIEDTNNQRNYPHMNVD